MRHCNPKTGSSKAGATLCNTSGSFNVALGKNALRNSTSDFNNGIGYKALRNNTTGTRVAWNKAQCHSEWK